MVRGNFGFHLLQMGHQQVGAVKRRIGKGQLLLLVVERELESGGVQLHHRGLKMASCNDESLLDEKPSHCSVITSFLPLLHLEAQSLG